MAAPRIQERVGTKLILRISLYAPHGKLKIPGQIAYKAVHIPDTDLVARDNKIQAEIKSFMLENPDATEVRYITTWD